MMDTTKSAGNSGHGLVTVAAASSGTPVLSITSASAFRTPTYAGVKHGAIPTNVVDTQTALLA